MLLFDCLNHQDHFSLVSHIPCHHRQVCNKEHLYQAGNNGAVYDVCDHPGPVASAYIIFQSYNLLPTQL